MSKEKVGSATAPRPGGAQWIEVREEFFADLDRRLDATKLDPDIVLITGDLALSGQAKQYKDFDAEFLEPLLARLRRRGTEALVFAVPGNHDVQRPEGNDLLRYRSLLDYDKRDDEDKYVKQLRASLWTLGKADAIAPLFQHYAAWMEGTMLRRLKEHPGAAAGVRVEAFHTSHIPGDFSVIVSKGAVRLLVVGLNSAWIQFDDTDVKGKLHVPQEQLFAALGPDELRCFEDLSGALLLMHHPRDWLSPGAQGVFDESIFPAKQGRFSACLFGHMHEARSELRAVSGRSMRHFYQSPSLFGLEHYGETQQRLDVGYTLGALDEHEGIKLWVRRLVRRASGTQVFDFDTALDRDDDDSTELRPPRATPRRAPATGGGGGSKVLAATEPQRTSDVEQLHAWLRAHHGELQLLSPSDSFRYSFDKVHIPLQLSMHESWSEAGHDGTTHDRDLVRSSDRLVELPEIFERVGDRCAVAIFGEPGAGKTTTLQKIAHQMRLEGGRAVGLPESTEPLFVRLHRLEHDDFAQPDPLLCLARREAQGAAPRLGTDVLERLWDRGGLLILLDGLDEIADDVLRERLIEHLVATTEQDRARGLSRLVSSRFSGVTPAIRRRLDDRFLRLDVQPLDPPGIEGLVRRWYSAFLVSKRSPRTSEERSQAEAEADERATRLLAKLRADELEDAALRVLLGTPLMLTLLCAIAFVDGRIPTRRRSIYTRCVEVLLRRYTEKTGKPAPAPEDELLALLAGVAYELHEARRRNGLGVARLAAFISARPGEERSSPAELLHWLHKHAGLLTKLGRDDYGFAHLTFQEYFAAREIDRRGAGLVEQLADHIGDPWWQEVILLCLSSDRVEVFSSFLRRALAGSQWHLDVPVQSADDPDVQARSRPPWQLLQRCWSDARERPIELVREVIERPRSTPLVEEQRARALQLLYGEKDDGLVEIATALGRDPESSEPVRASARRLVERARGAWFDAPSLAEAVIEDAPQVPERLVFPLAGTVTATMKVKVSGGVGGVPPRNPGAEVLWFEETVSMGFRWVPGGTFIMGSPEGEPYSYGDECPPHAVTLRGFWLAETPVTNAQYAKYMKAVAGVAEPRMWRDRRFSAQDQPVVGVSWHDAQGFCTWLSQQGSPRYTLPSEAQWEYTARGTDGRRYPWGYHAPDTSRACFGKRADGPALVGQYPHARGPFGHLDLAGGVWEWCQDMWDPSAYHHPDIWKQIDPVLEGEQAFSRVCRGGAWNSGAQNLRAACRSNNDSEGRGDDIGFRVCWVPADR